MESVSHEDPVRLPALTGLRWYAALLVFGSHIATETQWGPAQPLFVGFTGVTFFFVLSGFVLTWGYRPGSSGRFLWRRMARIYPAHLAMWLMILPLLSYLDKTFEPFAATGNALLFQAWFGGGDMAYSMNSPSWSLSCEISFYLAFPVLVRFLGAAARRTRWVVTGVGLAIASLITALVLVLHDAHWTYNNPAIRIAEFLVGITLALELRSGWRPRMHIWPMVIIFCAAAVGTFLVPGAVLDTYIMVVPFGMLVLYAAVGRGRAVDFLSSKRSIYLGEVSFAFYLVHYLIINVLSAEVGAMVHPSVLALLALLGSLVAAVALHHSIELPARRWLIGLLVARPGQHANMKQTALIS